ncbi:unnamed protein product [Psylliodes chrysocephalus]|uniref:Cadherin n=1 Tax=Psylliodes chrysocephalus TaxID=3402493 RepID=A0A9P0D200_9CUCU|nr:unnamed protein product [Psylliodes chrysocephala]
MKLLTKFIRIGIADKNDNPPYFDKALYEAEVDENEDIQHTVLTVTAKDHDELDAFDVIPNKIEIESQTQSSQPFEITNLLVYSSTPGSETLAAQREDPATENAIPLRSSRRCTRKPSHLQDYI